MDKELIESDVLLVKPGTLLIQGTFRSFTFPRHLHEEYSIGFVEQGMNRFRCQGETWVARAGSICVVNPDEIHTGEADAEGWRYTNLFVRPDVFSHVLGYESSGSLLLFKSHVFTDAVACRNLLNLAEVARTERDSMAVDCAYALALARLGEIANVPVKEKRASECAILRVRDMLDSICDRTVTLTELADAADMDTFYLVHSFTDAYGISPYAYHLNRRLLKAQRLIEKGVSITEAAFTTGFADQAHFTRHFRRFLGVTPGRVVKLLKS